MNCYTYIFLVTPANQVPFPSSLKVFGNHRSLLFILELHINETVKYVLFSVYIISSFLFIAE